MRRLHLFEISDKRWCPRSLRATVTDYIQFGVKMWELDIAIASFLRPTLERFGVCKVVDLCSGSGGPWLRMLEVFEGTWLPVRVCLTDKYPNETAFEYLRQVSHGILGFSSESVDATHVPKTLVGFRTMFAAFHHFRPGEARAILRDAVSCGQGIAVFEVTQRRLRAVFIVIAVSFLIPFCVPFLRPFRWSRLVWTYLIPIVPVVHLFDSFVSCLRSYSISELQEMTTDESLRTYIWEAGEIGAPHSPVPITYLLGYPGRS